MAKDGKFTGGAYAYLMFISDLYTRCGKDLNLTFDEFIVLQVVVSQWIYNTNQNEISSYNKMFENSINHRDYLKTVENTKLTILSIANILAQPKETVRRRIQKLIDFQLLTKKDDGGIVLGENYIIIIREFSHETTKQFSRMIKYLDKEGLIQDLVEFDDQEINF
jgi:predicted transcriptional regulator